jgi:hypothetical protein
VTLPSCQIVHEKLVFYHIKLLVGIWGYFVKYCPQISFITTIWLLTKEAIRVSSHLVFSKICDGISNNEGASKDN